jgi:drug/metabolite transporter (DMT)-like permease
MMLLPLFGVKVSPSDEVFRDEIGGPMRWFGIFLALAGVVVALVGGYSFESTPLIIGGIVFAVIGLIIFTNGTRTQPK